MKKFSNSLLLDGNLDNLSFAYSVRRVNSLYNGPIVRGYRSMDGSVRDFYDFSDIEKWAIGSSNVYAITWYDQSGNGADNVQSTYYLAPIIATGGKLVRYPNQSNSPALYFQGTPTTSSYYNTFYFKGGSYTNTVFMVWTHTMSWWTGDPYIFDSAGPNRIMFETYGPNSKYIWITKIFQSSVNCYLDTPYIEALTYNSTSSVIETNGVPAPDAFGDPGNATWDNLHLGSRNSGTLGSRFFTTEMIGYRKGFLESGVRANTFADAMYKNQNNFFNTRMIAPRLLDNLIQNINGFEGVFSTRKLKSTATSCMQVRRSTDNVTLDIGFDQNDFLDVTTLLSFVGAANGYVTTWYDQSGRGNNLTQASASPQPTIVLAGVLKVVNGNIPALYADVTDSTKVLSLAHFYQVSTGFYPCTTICGFRPTADAGSNQRTIISSGGSKSMSMIYYNASWGNKIGFNSSYMTPANSLMADTNHVVTMTADSTCRINIDGLEKLAIAVAAVTGIDSVNVGQNFNYSWYMTDLIYVNANLSGTQILTAIETRLKSDLGIV